MTEELLSAEQRKLIRIVVFALMHQLDVHATAAEHITPHPSRDDVNSALRVVTAAGYRRGMPAEQILRRIIEAMGKARYGDGYVLPPDLEL